MNTPDPILVEVCRDGLVESVHRGRLVIHTGVQTRRMLGEVTRPVFVRSSAKPFQAAAVVASGAADAFGFTDAEIALIAASHSGEPEHVELARSILGKAGVPIDAMLCGAHSPLNETAAAALVRAGEKPTALHNNCSGKHAGMLALAKHLGAPLADYVNPSHPAQARILDTIARCAGVPRSSLVVAIDGCSAPAPAMPLVALARAFAMLADPTRLPPELQEPVRRVADAMSAHPRLYAGTGRFDTLVGEATGGRVIAKGGAEGVLGIAILPLGIGVAMKAMDGNWRGVYAPAAAILREYGILDESESHRLDRHVQPIIRNHAHIEVGTVRVPKGVLDPAATAAATKA
ncbi:MAG: asparaginase [Planctomycetes bacterium]|nr:asparaginase [Planctomycetota bacterium]MBI3846228.1 asparaginase [Planctomycetota bacterium]